MSNNQKHRAALYEWLTPYLEIYLEMEELTCSSEDFQEILNYLIENFDPDENMWENIGEAIGDADVDVYSKDDDEEEDED